MRVLDKVVSGRVLGPNLARPAKAEINMFRTTLEYFQDTFRILSDFQDMFSTLSGYFQDIFRIRSQSSFSCPLVDASTQVP